MFVGSGYILFIFVFVVLVECLVYDIYLINVYRYKFKVKVVYNLKDLV